ncbi:hypothetical protein SAMN04488595_105237 [Ralstonia sp. 25mfcol4.1]|uniref:hypothetical protein n=1 Tax=Burkholderiaceae TaxID=119060 RepID=UPI000882A0E8|nr:hypothetical protein [Ralstonia sp. 25mfcol4.1]SDP18359.1 hypothetical protein SAMN04488595_105237 [Ralstonia sp. 25mfcol4.1]
MRDYIQRVLFTVDKRTAACYAIALMYFLFVTAAWNRPVFFVGTATPPWSTNSTIASLYVLSNAARVFTYVPQLMAVWRSNDGARDISLLTWGSWVVANGTALAYGAVVVEDLFLTLIALLNLTCCSAITLLAVQRRRTHRQEEVLR